MNTQPSRLFRSISEAREYLSENGFTLEKLRSQLSECWVRDKLHAEVTKSRDEVIVAFMPK